MLGGESERDARVRKRWSISSVCGHLHLHRLAGCGSALVLAAGELSVSYVRVGVGRMAQGSEKGETAIVALDACASRLETQLPSRVVDLAW